MDKAHCPNGCDSEMQYSANVTGSEPFLICSKCGKTIPAANAGWFTFTSNVILHDGTPATLSLEQRITTSPVAIESRGWKLLKPNEED